MNPGEEPIEDDEILYRRIPERWFNGNEVEDQAFLPHRENDVDGLSLTRAKYSTPEEALGAGRPGKRYYIAVLRADDLRKKGLRIQPNPLEGNRGHCILPDIVSTNRKTDETRTMARSLALDLDPNTIEGPFGPFA